MRNGVLAMTRAGALVLLNEEGYRIFGVEPHDDDLGKPIAEVLRPHPEVVRQLLSAFDLHMLPNRAEMRLRPSGKVIGYTLAFVRDDEGDIAGVAMFFKDLTRVEQLVERERLRDRLAAVGEMAAAIAHEVKNPLAGIEVMAGLLRRKIPDIPDAQAVLTDIIAWHIRGTRYGIRMDDRLLLAGEEGLQLTWIVFRCSISTLPVSSWPAKRLCRYSRPRVAALSILGQ